MPQSKVQEIYEPNSKTWRKINDEIERLKEKKYKLLGLTDFFKEMNRLFDYCKENNIDYEKYETPARPNTDILSKRHEIEIAELDVKIEELESKERAIWNIMESVFKINDRNSKCKRVSKVAKRKLEAETCAICFEEHNISKIVTIDCGHSFGKPCFEQLIETNYDRYIETSCPCCRHIPLVVTRYR